MGVVTPNGGATFTDVKGNTDTINVQTSDAYGGGGGIIWEYDYANKSYLRIFGLFGWGAVNTQVASTPTALLTRRGLASDRRVS